MKNIIVLEVQNAIQEAEVEPSMSLQDSNQLHSIILQEGDDQKYLGLGEGFQELLINRSTCHDEPQSFRPLNQASPCVSGSGLHTQSFTDTPITESLDDFNLVSLLNQRLGLDLDILKTEVHGERKGRQLLVVEREDLNQSL